MSEYTAEYVAKLAAGARDFARVWRLSPQNADAIYTVIRTEAGEPVSRTVSASLLDSLADALDAVTAERDEVTRQQEDLEDRLSAYLCDSTGGRLSKTSYDASTMIQHTEEYYDELHSADLKEVEAQYARLHKAITEALEGGPSEPGGFVMTETPRRILRAALDQEGDSDE